MTELDTLVVVCLSVLLSLCYCYYICSRIPKGLLRLLSLLPIFYLFTILPIFISSALTTAIFFFSVSWLANFKLLLFCFDHGPISLTPPKSLLLFITLASFPCQIKGNKNDSDDHTKPKKIPLNISLQILLIAMLVKVVQNNRQANYIHPKIVLLIYFFAICFWIDVLVTLPCIIVRAVVGLDIEQQASNEPYLSTSLQDFWGHRWNLAGTDSLRRTVYLPVRSASSGFIGKDMASLLAMFFTFVVSAIMHELLLYQIFPTKASTWEMGSFFLVHGMCVIIELILKRAFNARGCCLPPLVSWLLTFGVMLVTGFWLYFPPVINNGLDVKIIDEGVLVLEYIMSNLEDFYLSIQTKLNHSWGH